jgi:hypothetical protein
MVQLIQNDVGIQPNLLVVVFLIVYHHAIEQEYLDKQHQENKVQLWLHQGMYERNPVLLIHHLVLMTFDTRKKK